MHRTRALSVALVALLAVSIVGPTVAFAQTNDPLFVQGEPDLTVDVPDATVTPGSVSELGLQISNDGRIIRGSPANREIVTSARNVRVEADIEGPLEVETGQQSVGTVTENQPRSAPIAVTVPDDAAPGTYELEVELQYRHTSQLYQRTGITNERRRTVTRTVDVEVDDAPRFELNSTSTDTRIGDSGVMETTIENVGSQPATDVRLSLESTSPLFAFGSGSTGSVRAGSLAPGENATVRFDVVVDPRASVREFALDGTARYSDPDGVPGVDEGLSTGIEPAPEQRFSFETVESTLRVGEEGELRGTVRNDGPAPVRSVVVQFADQSPNVVPIESSVAVGSLAAGETAEFRLPIELTEEAEPIPQNFDMAVAYRNEENERRLFEDIDASASVEPNRDEFLLEVEDREIATGSSTIVEVDVTNNLDEPVRNLESKLFTDDPIASDDDEGYTESLAPGETTTVSFSVSAASGATPRTYPLQLDFRYDDESGTSKISDTYRTAIVVTDAEEGGFPWLLVVGAVVLVVVVGGALYWRRRD
ncbi:MAG: COG1361 S-layer family protein [Natronomonas sp.]|uniref:COG1361 S-layer family protein n=1 Tax=Natronomonas sp. TaxID=2184060 RepID=UPI0028700E92|nr:COG1361 S-layer family protein [Natronomonas sp.]MDR9429496.1 COG1361 S-layer family protein [Natronomonas sp.]